MELNEPFLRPIEKPDSLLMRVVYFLTKRKFGKVLTPVKVGTVRLPIAFGMFLSKPYELDKKLLLSRETVYLIRHLVASINVCDFCIDMGRHQAMNELMLQEKIDAVTDFRNSHYFSIAEKTALSFAAELTMKKLVNPNTFSKLKAYYTERQICEIVYLVASEHLVNFTNIGLNIQSDMFCDISKKSEKKVSKASNLMYPILTKDLK